MKARPWLSPLREVAKQVRNGHEQTRMHPAWSDLSQRREHKSSLVHCGMREREFLAFEGQLVIEEQIQVENPGTFRRNRSPIPPHRLLDRQQPM